MDRVITGYAADWLGARRDDLNRRFQRAQQRVPTLSPGAVLDTLADVLPALAGPEPAAGELLSSVYDLVILHAARDTFATRPGLDCLLREVFPRIRPLLLTRPLQLPGALSNAVENLGKRGREFALELGRVLAGVERAEVAFDLAGVVAWCLGEARLRDSALEAAARLPGGSFLRALGLDDFPETSAPLVLAGLRAHGFQHPRTLWREETLRASDHAALLARLQAKQAVPLANYRLLMHVGDFVGFGGHFQVPPWVLDGGGEHHFFARALSQDFRIDADVFGWSCTPVQEVGLSLRPVGGGNSRLRQWLGSFSSSGVDAPRLEAAGTLTLRGDRANLPALARATAFTVLPGAVVSSHADSHRLRVVGPLRDAL